MHSLKPHAIHKQTQPNIEWCEPLEAFEMRFYTRPSATRQPNSNRKHTWKKWSALHMQSQAIPNATPPPIHLGLMSIISSKDDEYDEVRSAKGGKQYLNIKDEAITCIA